MGSGRRLVIFIIGGMTRSAGPIGQLYIVEWLHWLMALSRNGGELHAFCVSSLVHLTALFMSFCGPFTPSRASSRDR